MKCFQEETYMLFLDGELGIHKEHRIAAHLKKCERCQEKVHRLKDENSGISRLLSIDHKIPDMTQSIMERIRPQEKTAHFRQKILSPYFGWGLRVAAAFLLIAFMFLFLFRHEDSTTAGIEKEVLLCRARVEGRAVQPHFFTPQDADIKFIWLDKI